MLTLCLFLLAAPQAVPIDLARITPDEARKLDGQIVKVVLTLDQGPSWYDADLDRTVMGLSGDAIERTITLPGENHFEAGSRVRIVGKLTVGVWAERTFGRQKALPWTSIRVDGLK